MTALTWDWAFWTAGGLTGLAGLLLCAWSLLHDRPRGRRRCPKCWYDMSAVPGLKCPECGRTARAEKRLFRTRRRWRWVVVGTFIMALGTAGTAAPLARSGEWVAYVPTPLLNIVLASFPGEAKTQYAAATSTPPLVAFARSTPPTLVLAPRTTPTPASISGSTLTIAVSAPTPASSLTRLQRLLAASHSRTLIRARVRESRPATDAELWAWMLETHKGFVVSVEAGAILPHLGAEARLARPALLDLLRSGNPAFQDGTALTLSELAAGAGDVVGPARRMLRSSNPHARQGGCIALSRLGVPAQTAVPRLLVLARRDPSARVRAAALGALAVLGSPDDPAIAQRFAAASADPDRLVRLAAVLALDRGGALRDDLTPWSGATSRPSPRPPRAVMLSALEPLAAALADVEPDIRGAAADILGRRGEASAPAAGPLLDAIEREHGDQVRRRMVRSMAAIQPAPRLVPYLTRMADEWPAPDAKWAVAQLGRYGEDAGPAIPTLVSVARRATEQDALTIVRCLAHIGTAAAPVLAVLMLEHDSDHVRYQAALALHTEPVDPCGVAASLVRALDDRNADVRREAAWALSHCPDEARPFIERLGQVVTTDSDSSARSAAVLAIARAGRATARAPQLLTAALRDPNEYVRFLAASRLADLAPDAAAARAALTLALDDPEPFVRSAAQDALDALDAAARAAPVPAETDGAQAKK